jgi:SAM-dependent methyltransferase
VDTRARFVASLPTAGSLLDLGSSDGETLRHFAELRPDLRLFAADKVGQPEKYPDGCQFQTADFERDRLPWPDRSLDGITCMHLVEHLSDLSVLIREIGRLLKTGGIAYIETPHPRTLHIPSGRGTEAQKFTLNFYDDPTHVHLVELDQLARIARPAGLERLARGVSRNWVFAASYPLFALLPASRRKFTARVHWLGWSAYIILRQAS